MRKTILILALAISTLFTLSSCVSAAKQDISEINVMLVDGAPLLSAAKIMSDFPIDFEGYGVSYTLSNNSDALVAALLNKEPDFAIAPINVAAMMHNNGSGYRLAAVTTWGIMHIVSDRDISSLEDLKGETVIAFGRSGTPGITLRAVLEQHNIGFSEPSGTDFTPDPDTVNIVYLTAASDVRDAIATGMVFGNEPASYGLLAEPVATAITGFASNAGRPGFTAKINLQDEWAKTNGGQLYPQAALIFNERLLESDAGLVDNFIAEMERASIYANENPLETGDLAVYLGSIAIPNGTIVENAYNADRLPINFTKAVEAKTAVDMYLNVLFEENPELIGGKMTEDSFYYDAEDK